MKKIGIFLFLVIPLLIPLIVYSQGSSTGVGLTILDAGGPSIELIGLINNSGLMHGNATFLFNATDATGIGRCSILINGKINFTNSSISEGNISKYELFNLPLGSFNFSISCEDDLNFSTVSPYYTVIANSMNEFNGSSTNISAIGLRNITNFVAEVTSFGRINFTDFIDLSSGLDLDRFINITSNKIELDSTVLMELNKSATLYLYGLTFANPRVVRDGIVCPSTICAEVSYSGGTFAFNVTHFSSYEAEETPGGGGDGGSGSSGGGGGGGGGSGAGGGKLTVLDFATDKKTIKVVLKQGQTKEETLTIKNTGTEVLDITTYLQTLKAFIFSPTLEEIRTTLNPNEEQTLNLIFGAEESLKPDVYTGEIKVRGGAIEKIVGTIIEVESAKPLFDVDVEVLPEYKSIFPGDDVFIDVSLFNIRGFGRVDVFLEYSIRDFQGNVIAKEEETVAVETQAKFTRELLVPSDIGPGVYVASVKVTFEDSVGISSDVFEVKAKAIRLYPIALKGYATYLLLGIIFTFGVSIVMLYRYLPRKKAAPKTREEETKVIKSEAKMQKLKKELDALEKAHKSGFISKTSYMRSRDRIEKEIGKLRQQ